MSNRLSAMVGLLVLTWTGSALALGLGDIEAKSHLNQPFLAHIAISSSSPAELDSLVVALASNEDFERAGLERPEYLSSLLFDVQGSTIRVRSKELARAPFVTFLVDLRWKGGRLLREYTLFLDPPTLAQSPSSTSSAAPVSSKPTAPVPPTGSVMSPSAAPQSSAGMPPASPAMFPPSSPKPAAPATASVAPSGQASSGTYGPVEPRETLWSIAYRLRPDADSMTMDQMQVALLKANPQAFNNGDLSELMKGAVLRIPSRAEILAVDPVAAKAQVARARSGASAPVKSTPVAEVAPKPVPTPAPKIEPKPELPPVAKAEPAPAPKPESKPEPKPVPPPVAKAEPVPEPVETPKPAAKIEPAPAQATSPDASPSASAPTTETASAPASTAPPSEPAAVVASGDPVKPAEAKPTESAPAPNPAAAPVIKKPKYDVEWTGFLDRGKELVGPYALPAIAGILILVAGLFGFGRLRDKYAQWSYNRASRKEQKAPTLDAEADETEVEGTDNDATALHPSMGETQSVETPDLGATQSMDQNMAATMQQAQPGMDATMQHETGTAAPAGRAVDFDVTGQYASETVQINLDAGDPVSEAEFHRAYGLYDEAALLLKQALVKDPKRTDAKVKLAEIYFEASKPTEFIAVATELKASLPDAEWQKIALMGSQIAPQEALFSGASVGAAGATVDLSFDEPAAPVAAPKPAPKAAAKAAAEKPAAGEAVAAAPDMLDFKLDDAMDVAAAPAAPAPAPAPAAAAEGESLEFDLGGLSLDEPAAEAPEAASAESAEPAAEEFKMDSLDLGDFDLGESAGTDPSSMEVDSGTGDDASTKLDLARAYVDMGDNDMAKGLLDEVMSQGNDQQKKEAGELLQRVQA